MIRLLWGDGLASYCDWCLWNAIGELIGILTLQDLCLYNLWQDNSQYETTTDVRGQLKILESIDRIVDSRRQEKEKEKILKAATSRSKQDNPELAKKKEQAKQVERKEKILMPFFLTEDNPFIFGEYILSEVGECVGNCCNA